MAKRTYCADLPGGTASTTIQIQGSQTLKQAFFSLVAAAAGSVELSLSATSQIGTAQPTSDVITRLRLSATAAHVDVVVPINVPVKPFQSVYCHQTGAGNVGQLNLG